MYEIIVKSFFSAAHFIEGYHGVCATIHGHTWGVTVRLMCKDTDKIGISYDFKLASTMLKQIIAALDHKNLNTVTDIEGNPTAENIARFFYFRLKKLLPGNVFLKNVEISESPKYSVVFSEE